MNEKELKPCPFCGERSVHLDKAYSYFNDTVIYCENCDIVFALDDVNAKEEQLMSPSTQRVWIEMRIAHTADTIPSTDRYK